MTPVVPVPERPSYPSEHAVAAGAASAVLAYLFPDKAKFLADKAEECDHSRLLAGVQFRIDNKVGLRLGREVAAASRLLGGVHFRIDNEVGLLLGHSVASIAIERARLDGSELPGERRAR